MSGGGGEPDVPGPGDIRPGPFISPADREANAELDRADDARLTTVRASAEKWLGGLTAFTGLLGVALVLQGPEQTGDLADDWRFGVILLAAIGLVALVGGVYFAYRAAYGEPGQLLEIDRQRLADLAVRLREARRVAAGRAQADLALAVFLTVVGVGVVAAATVTSWVAPPPPAAEEASLCVSVDGVEVLRMEGSTLTVARLAEGAAVAPCP